MGAGMVADLKAAKLVARMVKLSQATVRPDDKRIINQVATATNSSTAGKGN